MGWFRFQLTLWIWHGYDYFLGGWNHQALHCEACVAIWHSAAYAYHRATYLQVVDLMIQKAHVSIFCSSSSFVQSPSGPQLVISCGSKLPVSFSVHTAMGRQQPWSPAAWDQVPRSRHDLGETNGPFAHVIWLVAAGQMLEGLYMSLLHLHYLHLHKNLCTFDTHETWLSRKSTVCIRLHSAWFSQLSNLHGGFDGLH